MSRYPDAYTDIDEGDDDAPFDDPVARTRMAWLRTLLIVSVVGLLLWRSAYVAGQEWWSLGWFVPSLVMVGVCVARMRDLARNGVGDGHITALAWMVAGFLALATVGVILVAV